jgi:hypothetical protein
VCGEVVLVVWRGCEGGVQSGDVMECLLFSQMPGRRMAVMGRQVLYAYLSSH